MICVLWGAEASANIDESSAVVGGDRRRRRIDVCGATGIGGIACGIIDQKCRYGRLERCCTGRYAGQRGLLGDIAYQCCSGGIGMIASDGFGMQTVLPRLQRQFGGQLAQFLSCCRAIGGAGIHLTRGQMGDERRHGRIMPWQTVATDGTSS